MMKLPDYVQFHVILVGAIRVLMNPVRPSWNWNERELKLLPILQYSLLRMLLGHGRPVANNSRLPPLRWPPAFLPSLRLLDS